MKAGFETGEAPSLSQLTDSSNFSAPSIPELAKLFPQLEITELLGHGGMGAVYKARQPGLDRWIALKVLPRQAAAKPGFAERFNREARALARLNHPNIVSVHDFGQVDGLAYLILEYVDGVTLRRLVAEQRLRPQEALHIVPQICEALQFAHDEGIVHRDIKPENILLDTKGRVKIADFGIAKILDQPIRSGALTEVQGVIGTPHYMAPEQVEKPQSVDHRADIYSLGVVFYEMLTGELPLGRFAPPSRKVQIDVRLDEVVLRALEKEPERRYQQASELETDVQTITGATTPPLNPGPDSHVQALARVRNRMRIPALDMLSIGRSRSLVFALVAFTAAGAGLWWWQRGASELTYQTEPATRGDITVYYAATGRLRPVGDGWAVDAVVGESDVAQVAPGQDVQVTLDAFHDQRYAGKISTVSEVPAVGPRVNYPLVITIANPAPGFRPGMTAMLSIVVAHREAVLRVPNLAILFRMPDGEGQRRTPLTAGVVEDDSGRTERTIWLVKKSGRPEPVLVRTGISDGELTEVTAGLSEGDQVVVGISGLRLKSPDLIKQQPTGPRVGQDDFLPTKEIVFANGENLQSCFLDLENARLLSAPVELVQSLAARGQLRRDFPFPLKALLPWIRSNHVDLVKQSGSKRLTLVDGMGVLAGPHALGFSAYDSVEIGSFRALARTMDEALAIHTNREPQSLVQYWFESKDTWIFKTRQGQMGVLELLETNRESGPVRIRYKLAKRDLAAPTTFGATNLFTGIGSRNNAEHRQHVPAEISRPPLLGEPPLRSGGPTFGTVIACKLTFPSQTRTATGIDLESGRIVQMPSDPGDAHQRARWMHQNHVEMTAVLDGGAWFIWTTDVALAAVSEHEWASPSFAEVRYALAHRAGRSDSLIESMPEVEGATRIKLRQDLTQPDTFSFLTAAGSLGVMRVDVSEGRPSAQIKYRTVESQLDQD